MLTHHCKCNLGISACLMPCLMHGLHNVLNGVLMAAVRAKFSEKGLVPTEVNRVCSMGLQCGEDWLDDDTILKKTIT